jgi:hypothetical protein
VRAWCAKQSLLVADRMGLLRRTARSSQGQAPPRVIANAVCEAITPLPRCHCERGVRSNHSAPSCHCERGLCGNPTIPALSLRAVFAKQSHCHDHEGEIASSHSALLARTSSLLSRVSLGAGLVKQSHSSSYKSRHSLFNRLTRSIFFCREPALICFSRAIASRTSLNTS